MATKSYSSSYNRSRRPEISVGLDSFPLKVSIKSSVKPILPTVIDGFFVNFFVHPAKLSSDPSNSLFQNLLCEQWKQSTPAIDRLIKNLPN